MLDKEKIAYVQAQLTNALLEIAQMKAATALMERATALAENVRLQALVDAHMEKTVAENNYLAMIRRRAAALQRDGEELAALLLLKTIGE